MEHNGYKIVGDGTFGMKKIASLKGPLPKELNGSFTTVMQAERLIDAYVRRVDEAKAKRAVKPTPPKLRQAKKDS